MVVLNISSRYIYHCACSTWKTFPREFLDFFRKPRIYVSSVIVVVPRSRRSRGDARKVNVTHGHSCLKSRMILYYSYYSRIYLSEFLLSLLDNMMLLS